MAKARTKKVSTQQALDISVAKKTQIKIPIETSPDKQYNGIDINELTALIVDLVNLHGGNAFFETWNMSATYEVAANCRSEFFVIMHSFEDLFDKYAVRSKFVINRHSCDNHGIKYHLSISTPGPSK